MFSWVCVSPFFFVFFLYFLMPVYFMVSTFPYMFFSPCVRQSLLFHKLYVFQPCVLVSLSLTVSVFVLCFPFYQFHDSDFLCSHLYMFFHIPKFPSVYILQSPCASATIVLQSLNSPRLRVLQSLKFPLFMFSTLHVLQYYVPQPLDSLVHTFSNF